MAMTVVYIDIWQSRTQKITGFVIPFVVYILVTELPEYLTLVRLKNSAQLRRLGPTRNKPVLDPLTVLHLDN